MRFERGRSRDEFLSDLRSEAERTWGLERLEPLEPSLLSAAAALVRLADAPLDLLEAEPDFIRGIGHPAESHPS